MLSMASEIIQTFRELNIFTPKIPQKYVFYGKVS